MSKEEITQLEHDSNSLNAIATAIRYEGYQKMADVLLSIESHILNVVNNSKISTIS